MMENIELTKKLGRLKKRIRLPMMQWIQDNPLKIYKLLHHSMKGISRIHIGHLVLIFWIDHKQKTVSFEDYDHHDRIYQ